MSNITEFLNNLSGNTEYYKPFQEGHSKIGDKVFFYFYSTKEGQYFCGKNSEEIIEQLQTHFDSSGDNDSVETPLNIRKVSGTFEDVWEDGQAQVFAEVQEQIPFKYEDGKFFIEAENDQNIIPQHFKNNEQIRLASETKFPKYIDEEVGDFIVRQPNPHPPNSLKTTMESELNERWKNDVFPSQYRREPSFHKEQLNTKSPQQMTINKPEIDIFGEYEM